MECLGTRPGYKITSFFVELELLKRVVRYFTYIWKWFYGYYGLPDVDHEPCLLSMQFYCTLLKPCILPPYLQRTPCPCRMSSQTGGTAL